MFQCSMLNCAEVLTKTAKHVRLCFCVIYDYVCSIHDGHTHPHTHTHLTTNPFNQQKTLFILPYYKQLYQPEYRSTQFKPHTYMEKHTLWKFQVSEYGFGISFANPNLLFPALFLGTHNAL